MARRFGKKYGESKQEYCPFCGKLAFSMNKQGVAVCALHKGRGLNDFQCACGNSLDMRKSKYGAFFTCISCGAVSMSKALSVNKNKLKEGMSASAAPRRSAISSKGQAAKAAAKKQVGPKKPLTMDELKRQLTGSKETIVRSDEVDYYFG
jgi:hypothetical protein